MEHSKEHSLDELRWEVVQDYEDNSPEHLNLEIGEIVNVTVQSSTLDMWYGKKGLEEGWFPRNCVKEYKSGITYIVTYDYDGDPVKDELTVKKEDVVEMISLCKSGWVWVKSCDGEGFIPKNYTKVAETHTEVVDYTAAKHNDETIDEDYQRKYRKIQQFFANTLPGNQNKDHDAYRDVNRYMNQKIPDFLGKRLEEVPSSFACSTEKAAEDNDSQKYDKIFSRTSSLPAKRFQGRQNKVDQHVYRDVDIYMNEKIPDFSGRRSEGYQNKKDQDAYLDAGGYMNEKIPDYLRKRSEGFENKTYNKDYQHFNQGLKLYTNTKILEKEEAVNQEVVKNPSNTNDSISLDDTLYDYIDESQIQDFRSESLQCMTLLNQSNVNTNDQPPLPPRKKTAIGLIKEKISAFKAATFDIWKGFRDVNELRIVLVGKTGSGKSATGNTIMASTQFESNPGSCSITRQCKRAENCINGRKIVVVDTPGLFDTSLSKEEVQEEIIKCIQMSLPGPHIFLLVMQITRLTNEEIETFKQIFDYFGDGMSRFAIVTFTRVDDLDKASQTLEHFTKNGTKFLKELLERCENRYIGFNNYDSPEKKASKVGELLLLIDKILKANKRSHYSNKMYKEAEANLKRKMKFVAKQKELEKQREVEKIESKFTNVIQMVQEENKKLLHTLECQQKLAENVRVDKEKAQSEIRKMQNEIRTIDMKHNLELYRTKQQEQIEKEKLAKMLESKEKKTREDLRTMKQKLLDAEDKIKSIEKDKIIELEEFQKQHSEKVAEQLRQIIEANNEKMDSLLDTVKIKEIANENLRNEMNNMMKLKEKKLAELQQILHKEKAEAKAIFDKEISHQRNYFEKQNADLRQRLDKNDNERKELQIKIQKGQHEAKLKFDEELQKRDDLIAEKNNLLEQEKAERERTRQIMEQEQKRKDEEMKEEFNKQIAFYEKRLNERENETQKKINNYEQNMKNVKEECEKIQAALNDMKTGKGVLKQVVEACSLM